MIEYKLGKFTVIDYQGSRIWLSETNQEFVAHDVMIDCDIEVNDIDYYTVFEVDKKYFDHWDGDEPPKLVFDNEFSEEIYVSEHFRDKIIYEVTEKARLWFEEYVKNSDDMSDDPRDYEVEQWNKYDRYKGGI